MAAFSGASGMTISTKAPAPMPGSPTTRMTRDSSAKNTPSASDQSEPQRQLVDDPRRPRAGPEVVGAVEVEAAVGGQHQAAFVVALERHRLHLGGAQQFQPQGIG